MPVRPPSTLRPRPARYRTLFAMNVRALPLPGAWWSASEVVRATRPVTAGPHAATVDVSVAYGVKVPVHAPPSTQSRS